MERSHHDSIRWWDALSASPVPGLWKISIRVLFLTPSFLHDLVTLGSIARAMCELEVIQVAWVAPLGYWNNMVYCCRHRVGRL